MGFAEDDFLSYELDCDKGVDECEEIVLGVIQEWLFFGVLEQFGEIFDESGIERLSSQNLPSFFDRLVIKYDSGDVSVGSPSMPAADLMLSELSSGPLGGASHLESAAACVETSTGFLNDLWKRARRFPRIQIEHADVLRCRAFVEAFRLGGSIPRKR